MNYELDYHSKDKIYKSKLLGRNYFKRLSNRIDFNKDCLEIGGSFGFFSKEIQERKGCLVRNIEPSILASNYSNLQNIKTFNSVNDLDIKAFDYIFSFHVIEHIKSVDIKNFILEAINLLKPEGKFYIFTPNSNSFLLKLLGKHYTWLAPEEHLSFLSSSSFNYLINNKEVILSVTEEVPAFIHYPMISFVSFIRKKLFKHKISDIIEKPDEKYQKKNYILILKKIFHFFIYAERFLLYPIYLFLNLFISHHDELVIEIQKTNPK